MIPTERELRDGFFAGSAPDRGLYGRRRIEFTVIGLPEPKGSTRSFAFHAKDKYTGQPMYVNGKPVLRAATTSDNPKLKDWQHAVASGAHRALEQVPEPERALLVGPVAIDVVFELPRPKSAPKSRTAHTTRPDLDKLLRAVKDALTNVLWRDDGQVTEIRARKRYAEMQQHPRVFVAVEG